MSLRPYVMVTPAYPPHVGGVERHVQGLHRALAKMGVPGEVVVIDQQERPDPEAHWIAPERLRGVPRTVRLRTTAKLIAHLSSRRDAVLHFHDFGTIWPRLPALAALGWLDRTYVTFHGWEGRFPPDRWTVHRRRLVDRAVAGSLSIGAFIPKWYGTRAGPLSWGAYDESAFRASLPDWRSLEPRIAYLGRLEADTGVVELARAMRSLPGPVELHLFGHGRLADELTQIEGTRIKVRPPVANVVAVLRDYPVIFASGYLTILEALRARRHVFGWYGNALREDYLRLHPAAAAITICGSSTDVVAGVRRIFSHPADAERIAAAGWTWSQDQTFERLAHDYVAMWREVV